MSSDLVTVVEYDPRWPERYEREEERLLDAIGECVERIEHVGSTAVPGLAAKPIVDITATLADWDEADDCVGPVENLRYDYFPESAERDSEWRYFERRPEDGQAFNLHLRPSGIDHLERNLRLRDYLREHPGAAREYEEIKREAAVEHPDDIEAYSEAKTEFIESVMEAAGNGDD